MTIDTKKRAPRYTLIAFFWFAFVFINTASAQLSHSSIPSQPNNGNPQLVNPGFENPYIPIEDGSTNVVANGWTAWHIPQQPDMESFRNLQPEYSEAYPDTSRIRSGENAQVISTLFGTHDGGVYQRITGLGVESEVTFSIFAYVWSNDVNDEQSRQTSTNPGGITIQVGIDPTGGIDPESREIIWSNPTERYDAYHRYRVGAMTYSDTITVWVRTTIESPQAYNYIYLDDALLDTGGSTSTNNATDTPTFIPINIQVSGVSFDESQKNLLVDVSISERDSIDELQVYLITLDNRRILVKTVSIEDFTGNLTIPIQGYPNGDYIINITALDNNGNSINLFESDITLSASAPTRTLEPTNTREGIVSTSIAPTVQPTITSTSTPTTTQLPTDPNLVPTANNTPDNVAMLPADTTNVQVINQSGEIIGTGVIRVYHTDSVSPQNTTRVELELRFIEKFITATPFSDVTRVPITPVTSTPQPMRPTATPRIPKHEETGVQIQQLMGASLLCLPDSFSGCDETIDPTQYVFISEGGAFWSWTLRPQATTGVHDLQLELWTLVSVNGETRTNTTWQYPFTIIIGDAPDPTDSSDPLRSILIVLVGTIGIIAMVTVFYIQRRTSKPPTKNASNGKKPTVFLSYRRKVSWAVALKLHESLTQMGADVFMDMEDLGEGQFAQKLMQEIQSRDYFVLLLAPDTLSSEWVMREAEFAMKSGKRIIPVLTDGFQLSEENLPSNLKNIGSHNAVTLTLEFYNAGIERIGKFIGL